MYVMRVDAEGGVVDGETVDVNQGHYKASLRTLRIPRNPDKVVENGNAWNLVGLERDEQQFVGEGVVVI